MHRVEDDQLIGVPRATAARVIGVSIERLRNWNRIGLVLPSLAVNVGRRELWSYSLEDLVQGRVVRQLEDKECDVRVIRRLVEAVRSSTHPEPLSSLRWGASAGQVYVQYPDEQWVGGRAPAQGVIIEVINLEEIRTDARSALRRPAELAGQIEQRRGALGFKPLFAGTRIPVDAVLAYVRREIAEDEILEAFPDLRHEDIAAARGLLTA
jgi:uncharacterized protein (DUF433 family)